MVWLPGCPAAGCACFGRPGRRREARAPTQQITAAMTQAKCSPLMNEVITPWIRCGESGACRAMTSAAATELRAAANAGAGSAWTGEAMSRLR